MAVKKYKGSFFEHFNNGKDLWDLKANDILTSEDSNLGDWYKMES